MAIVDIARGQQVTIPVIRLTNGTPFVGVVRASDGESVMIDVAERAGGSLPAHTDEMVVMTWQADGAARSCPLIVRGSSPRSLVGQVVVQERREAPRLRVEMELTYEKVPPEKVKEAADEVMARVNALAEPISDSPRLLYKKADEEDDGINRLQRDMAGLRDMLGEVLARLDALTAMVAGQQDGQEEDGRQRSLQVMNVSSTGVGFIDAAPLQSGDYLRLHMIIHGAPRIVIDCMGAVVRCVAVQSESAAEAAGRYDVGVRFTHIHESDRERLIHYLFKVQRRMLRDLKEKRGALAEQA
jgi:ligand-binding sensor protein